MRRYGIFAAALLVALAAGLGAGSRAAEALPLQDVSIAAVYYPPGDHLEVFVVADDGSVRGVWKERNSDWRPPFNLTGPGFASPGAPLAAVHYPNGDQLEVFVVGMDGALWVIWKAGNGPWQPPGRLTPPGFASSTGDVTAIYYPNGEALEVFVAGTSGAVEVVWKQKGGNWQPPGKLTPDSVVRTGQPITAVYKPDGEQLHLFWVERRGSVQTVWKEKGGNWKPAGAITEDGFAPANAPIAGTYYPNGGAIELFVVGGDGALKVLWLPDDGRWMSGSMTGPDMFSSRAPLAVVYQPTNDEFIVAGVGKDGAIYNMWKARGQNWQPPARLSPPDSLRDGTPLALVYNGFNRQIELFAVDGYYTWTLRQLVKPIFMAWASRPLTASGPAITPLFRPSQCTAAFREWRTGRDPSLGDHDPIESCLWIMGIEPHCRAQNATAAPVFDGAGRRSHFKCAPISRPLDAVEQIERIAAGVAEGLVTAFVAAAPYLDLVVSGYACVQGVLYACAVVALEIANRAGVQLPGEAAAALAIADKVAKCVNGNVAACAALGAQGAAAAGITIPGFDAARVAEDARQCAAGTFAACVRLGLTAAGAAGVPTGGVAAGDVVALQDCLRGDRLACLILGRAAAQAAGFPLGGVAQGAENARRCADGAIDACIALGTAMTGATLPQGVENARKCAMGDSGACVDLAKAAVGSNMFLSSGTADEIDNAFFCGHGNVDACTKLGQSMVRRALPRGSENLQACATGNAAACIEVGKAAAGSGAVQDVEQARRCATGDTAACTAIARSLIGTQLPAANIPLEGRPDATPALPTIQMGASGEVVTTLQYLLRQGGVTVTVDGEFGPQTQAAVRTFQQRRNLTPADGVVRPQIWQALFVTVRQGNQGEAVRAVQSQLVSRGVDLAVDGDFGPLTAAAVRAYQQRLNLTGDGDGVVGLQTWTALVSGR